MGRGTVAEGDGGGAAPHTQRLRSRRTAPPSFGWSPSPQSGEDLKPTLSNPTSSPYRAHEQRDGVAPTIVSVRRGGRVVIAGDGQVSAGQTVMKPNARKVRPLGDGKVIAGFAGATADAFTLFERLEAKLERHQGQLLRAAVELAKDWRTDKFLRNLEAMLIVADKDVTLVVTGNGDVLEPEAGIAAIGSGGNFALAAARALSDYEGDAEKVARKALAIAAELCVYTNDRVTLEALDSAN